jgi:CheY-like chemotaxis protein
MAKSERPDLILLDVQMPEMSGVQVIAKLKLDKETEMMKVVFLTNLGEANPEDSWLDTKFAQETGALGHIKKTDDLDHILEEVNRYLTT